MKRCVLTTTLAVAALIVGCKDEPVAPATIGTISLEIITKPAAVTRASSAMTGAPPSANFDIADHIESARVQVIGPTDSMIDNLAPGTTVTIGGLLPGSYTVVLEGFVGGEVNYFGLTSGVQVQVDQNTTASISFNSFRPNLSAVSTATTAFNFRVSWPAVPNADGYEVEWDTDPGFSTADNSGPLTIPSYDIAFPTVLGTYYVRARTSNAFARVGRWADLAQVDVTLDISPTGTNAGTAVSFGFGEAADGQHTGYNIFPGGDEDWFALDACGGDVLGVEGFATRLDPL